MLQIVQRPERKGTEIFHTILITPWSANWRIFWLWIVPARPQSVGDIAERSWVLYYLKWVLVGVPAQMFHPGLQTFLQVTNFPHNLALFYILSAAYNSSLSFRLLWEGPHLKEVFVETPSPASPWNDGPPQLRLSACCACYFIVLIKQIVTMYLFLWSLL